MRRVPQPQIASDNLELLQSLATATGAKNAEWISAHVRKADELVAHGKMTVKERAALEPIYSAAASGQWTKAQEMTRQLAVGQRLDRVKDLKPKKPERREPPAGKSAP
jgi:hypothetical protein